MRGELVCREWYARVVRRELAWSKHELGARMVPALPTRRPPLRGVDNRRCPHDGTMARWQLTDEVWTIYGPPKTEGAKLASEGKSSIIRVPIGVGISGRVAQTGKPLVCADAYEVRCVY